MKPPVQKKAEGEKKYRPIQYSSIYEECGNCLTPLEGEWSFCPMCGYEIDGRDL